MKAIDADIRVTDSSKNRIKVPKKYLVDTIRKDGTIKTKAKSGTWQRLYQRYVVLAKRADQRLLELERLSREQGFEAVTKWAYARAMHDIKIWSGPDKRRFNTLPPMTTQGLQAKIKDIESFLLAPTSKRTTIKKLYVERANKIMSKYDLRMDWEDIAKFFDSEMWRKNADTFGSKTLLRAIGRIQRQYDKTLKKSKEDWTDNVRIPNKAKQSKFEEFMKHNKLELEQLFNG